MVKGILLKVKVDRVINSLLIGGNPDLATHPKKAIRVLKKVTNICLGYAEYIYNRLLMPFPHYIDDVYRPKKLN